MADQQDDVAKLFLQFSRKKLIEEFWPRLRTCVELLTDEQLSWRPNETSNSIANLMLHLSGNVRQWLLVSFNREEDRRQRSAEFAERSPLSAATLLAQLGATMDETAALLARLTPADLTARYEIQGYHVSGLEAVYHVVEHFGLHYGQIAYIAKALTAKDLGFYRELNATGRAH